jgi:dTDP-4-dehydrorhamnose reductase
MTRILITGGTGQVGCALRRHPLAAGFTVVAPDRHSLDLAQPHSIRAAFADSKPDAVINAGAYTAVDRAESEPDLAFAVNGTAAGVLAELCQNAGIPLLHVSTDYVFNGASARPWREDDPTGPLGVYGASKHVGEVAIRAACARHVILRTAWVFSADGQNFVKTMLRLGQEREVLQIVSDQTGCPTAAQDIAGALWQITAQLLAPAGSTTASPPAAGTFHYGGTPAVSWYDFATAIFALARQHGLRTPRCEPIPTSAYPTPARRPAWSVLDTAKITAVFGIQPPDWQLALAETVAAVASRG